MTAKATSCARPWAACRACATPASAPAPTPARRRTRNRCPGPPAPPRGTTVAVPAYPVTGPIDTVGAGDSSSAALACALACGAGLTEAASFANLVASITIQQIGTTGTASPEQVHQRWREIYGRDD